MELPSKKLRCRIFYENEIDHISAASYFNAWVEKFDTNIIIKQVDTVTTSSYHRLTIVVYYYEVENKVETLKETPNA